MTVAAFTKSIEPYVQLTRIRSFAGALYFFWPCAWALTATAISSNFSPAVLAQRLVLYLIGCTVLRSAACIWNDICDKDFDKLVERTKTRPLATGAISVKAAALFALPQVAFCVYMLCGLSKIPFQLGLFWVFVLNPIYPLCKRITYWPQAFLGLTINFGIMVAWTAELGLNNIAFPTLLLAAAFCWTVYYDTCYGFVDANDDAKIGVKSTALLFQGAPRLTLGAFAGTMVGLLAAAGYVSHLGAWYHTIAVGGVAAYLAAQILTLNVKDRVACMKAFKTNAYSVGPLVWAGLAAELLATRGPVHI